MTRQPKPRPVKHLLRRTEDQPGHITRYVAFCGASGTAHRDFSQNVAKGNVQVVTCQLCIMSINKKG